MLVAFLVAALQTATTCSPVGASVVCRSDGFRQAVPDYGAAARSGMASVPVYQVAPRAPENQLRKNVGRLIAKNNCQGAIDLALREGDMALAREARAYCAK